MRAISMTRQSSSRPRMSSTGQDVSTEDHLTKRWQSLAYPPRSPLFEAPSEVPPVVGPLIC
jgi:hypothetical protein